VFHVNWKGILLKTKYRHSPSSRWREIIQAISWEFMFWSAAEPLLSKFNGLLAHYSWEIKLHSNSSFSIGWVIPGTFLNFTGIGFGRRQIAFVGFKLCRKGKVRFERESIGVLGIVTPAGEEKLMSRFGGAGANGDWGRGANIDSVHAEVIARTGRKVDSQLQSRIRRHVPKNSFLIYNCVPRKLKRHSSQNQMPTFDIFSTL